MLSQSEVYANIPASELRRARTYYTEVLSLTPGRLVHRHRGQPCASTSGLTRP